MTLNKFNKKERLIIDLYKTIKAEIESRINDFIEIQNRGDEHKLFIELVFCILTPQSSAKNCWKAVEILIDNDLLLKGNFEEIRTVLNIVRFRNNKAHYIIEARNKLLEKRDQSLLVLINDIENVIEKRSWLVKNIKGIGYKEASHYLRNIGFGNDIAILDRHILRNMQIHGLIKSIPKSLSPRQYIDLENKLRKFSNKLNIPLSHIDFVLWYKEAGEVFK